MEASIDPNQFGGIKASSTAFALIKMVDYVAKNLDKPGTFIRMLLVDFAKAFDLVDHTIVLEKLSSLGVHESLVRWSASFLNERSQCVKIGSSLSEVARIHAGCPQGTIMGPLVFVTHINDLHPPGQVMTIKYVDDTNILHASNDSEDTTLQQAATYLCEWSKTNNMKFNIKKSKEIIFHSTKCAEDFLPITIADDGIERVEEAKILGVIIREDLKWNSHVEYMLKKANKRLYLLTLCRRAGLKQSDMLCIYTSLIRSIVEYCAVVWHSNLPKYLSDAVEKVQKRALHVIYGIDDYDECLKLSSLNLLSERREEQCRNLFKSIQMSSHKLHSLLPSHRDMSYNLRDFSTYQPILCHTNRYSNSFIPYCVKKF